DGEVGVRNGDRCGGRGGRSQGCEACACCCECDCVADGIALLTVLTHRNSCLSLLPLGGVLIRFLFSGCLPAGLLPSPFRSRKYYVKINSPVHRNGRNLENSSVFIHTLAA